MANRNLLVFGASGQTGQHFTRLALDEGYRVRALVRTPAELSVEHGGLEIVQGSITDDLGLDGLLAGVDAVVAMLGDVTAQRSHQINTALVRQLVPSMRRTGTRRFLYQAGGLSAAPGSRLPPALRLIRTTIARSYEGQHQDNEAVMRFLHQEASDIEWMVHRAGIGGDGPSKGELRRSATKISIGTFVDCATYNLRTLNDTAAIHTCNGSAYHRT